MADIQVRIKLNAGVSGDEIQSVDFNQETNNVSKPIGSSTTKNSGHNLISWGNVVKDSEGNIVSKVVNGNVVTTGLLSLADGYVGGMSSYLGKQGGYNGFVFGVVPENKIYSVEVSLVSVEGKNIDSVTVYGDRNAKQFPTRAYLDGDTSNYIYSDDAEWTIIFPTASQTHTITFDMWNRANYNACITHIGVFVNELVLDKRQIKSVESLSQSTGRPKDIYYGFTPSSGNIEIIDVNGEIKDYIQDGILESDNVPVSIYANNQIISENLLSIDRYSNESKSINSSLVSIMDNVLNSKHRIYPELLKNQTIQDILFQIFRFDLNYSQEEYMKLYKDDSGRLRLTFLYDDNDAFLREITIYDYLSSINIEYFIPYDKTYRELIQDILSLGQMSLVEIDGKQYKIISARPRLLSTDNPIIIPKNKQFSSFEYDIITRNKYDNVQAEVIDINHSIDVAYETEFSIVDNDGNISAEMINDTAQVKDIDGENCICFFLDINSSNPLYSFTNSYDDTNIYAYEIKLIGDTISYKKSLLDYAYSDETKSEYSFRKYSEIVALEKYSTLENHTFAVTINTTSISSPKSVHIRMMANKYEINTNDEKYNANGSNILSYPNSVYMTKDTKLNIVNIADNDVEIFSHISDNIIKDYSNGIRTGNISIACSDYYYENNSKAKTWENGDVIQVGDVVRIEGNDKLWRVTGRNFRKIGVPMLDLEVQELVYEKYFYRLIEDFVEKDVLIELSGTDSVYDFYLYLSYKFDYINGIVQCYNGIYNISQIKSGMVLYRVIDEDQLTIYEILEPPYLDNSNRWVVKCNLSILKVNAVN